MRRALFSTLMCCVTYASATAEPVEVPPAQQSPEETHADPAAAPLSKNISEPASAVTEPSLSDALSALPEELAPKTSPITYAKDQITLLPAKPVKESDQSGVLFQMEIRSAGSVLNPDWFQLSGFQPNHGLLLTYAQPEQIAIEPANVFAHYDIIAVNSYGEIEMIFPDLVLAEITQALPVPKPVSALMYIAGGSASSIGLTVGDHVTHAMFSKRTAVVDSADTTTATATEDAATKTASEPLPPEKNAAVTPPAEEGATVRRRPARNPVINKPDAPDAPTAPAISHPQKPTVTEPVAAVEPAAGTPESDVANSNLQQTKNIIPPVQSEETPEQKTLLDTILKRHYQ